MSSRNLEDKNSSKFVSETRLNNLSDEINQRYGLKYTKLQRSINPKLLQEADRPSILFQHIEQKKTLKFSSESIIMISHKLSDLT